MNRKTFKDLTNKRIIKVVCVFTDPFTMQEFVQVESNKDGVCSIPRIIFDCLDLEEIVTKS